MQILDLDLKDKEAVQTKISEALAEFGDKTIRIYLVRHNKTYKGGPTLTKYIRGKARITTTGPEPEPAPAPAPDIKKAAEKVINAPAKKKSHHNPAKGY